MAALEQARAAEAAEYQRLKAELQTWCLGTAALCFLITLVFYDKASLVLPELGTAERVAWGAPKLLCHSSSREWMSLTRAGGRQCTAVNQQVYDLHRLAGGQTEHVTASSCARSAGHCILLWLWLHRQPAVPAAAQSKYGRCRQLQRRSCTWPAQAAHTCHSHAGIQQVRHASSCCSAVRQF